MTRSFLLLALCAITAFAQSPTDTGAPEVEVSHAAGKWGIRGKKNTVELNESDLAVTIRPGAVTWKMVPSSKDDVLVGTAGDEFPLRLADAGEIKIAPYQTGFKTGVKIVLDRFRSSGQRAPGAPLQLRIVLTMCLEGRDEELVSEVTVIERGLTVRELNWPKEPDGREVDFTVIPSDDGTLLPRNWPKTYHPIHRAKGETSLVQSHLIESWAMSWWGFQKGDAAMIVIVETPDDAGYTFAHPAGGPTRMGPSWRAQLDRFAYMRSVRMGFLAKGNYVDLAKRYRRHVMDSGLYVSLRDKIAQRPIVRNLIGNPVLGARVLRNYKPGGQRYDTKNPENNYRLVTFAQNAQTLRDLKLKGFDNLNVTMSGWLNLGYDRQTPDALPPAKDAGGWEGMRLFFDTCKQVGYTCWLHDQYRDYYLDAPSWNPDFAIREEDNIRPPTAFPGTRFKHDWKDGYIPLMDNWDGGAQGYLNNGFMLGHVIKNYRTMFEHGIHPDGTYQDVFGYIPPDQDFNPEHPNTRTDSMKHRAAVMLWSRKNLGIVGTEDGTDWVIPYVDYLTSRKNRVAANGNDPDHEDAIQIPLYELVYHDAVVTTYTPADPRGFLHASAPEWSISRMGTDSNLDTIRRMSALHRRVGLLEMTNHEFLDANRRRERTTFSDGTTVTVDWDTKVVEIKPDVSSAPPASDMPAIVPPRSGRNEIIKLFDGKTLSGWEG
ncbi:MAG TPA: DUF5696 domain-containing protein, partial [Bryobacteraceae bacterium]|nr:DUF5696 domain-containing protein [Bryobacteraceae bacterium]